MQRTGADPGGLMGVIYAEELHSGCAGIARSGQRSGSSSALATFELTRA